MSVIATNRKKRSERNQIQFLFFEVFPRSGIYHLFSQPTVGISFKSATGDNHAWTKICENKIIKDYCINFSISAKFRI